MPRQCVAKQAMRRGLRPSAQNVIRGVCSKSCIFCDIWRLAQVIATHVPLSTRYSASVAHRNPDLARGEKMIEAQLQTQRARVASIMSICTVEGAEESEGLHMAYDRCLENIQDLLYQEEYIEEKFIRPSATMSRRQSRDAGCGPNVTFYPSETRTSRVSIAI